MSSDKIIEKATEAMKAAPDANVEPQDELVLSKTCFTCGKSLVGIPRKNLRVCSKCELVAYCSAECLRKGWKNHSKHCNPENAEKVRAAARLRAKMAAEEERRRAADPQAAALAAVKAVHDTDEAAKKKKDGDAAAVAAAVQAALGGSGADDAKKAAEGAEGAGSAEADPAADTAPAAKPLAVCGGETVVTTPEGCEQVSELAKKKLQALVGTGRATGMHALIGLRGETRTLVQEGVDAKATIVVQNCEHCKFEVACLCTKIFMMSCADVEITVPREGKVVSATFEAYTCRQIDVRTDTPLMTVQLDACTDFNIEFLHKECYRMVVWAGCENLTVGVRHATLAAADASASSVARKAPAADAGADSAAAEWTVKTGMTEMRKEFQNLRADIDQFKIHFVGDRLLNERVVRLNNGFPTTQREADDYDRRQELNMQKLAETMGITIKRKPRDPNKVRVKRNDLCPCGSGKRAKNCCYP